VNCIQIGDNFQPVRLNAKELGAFVDLGSEVTTLTESEKNRLNLNVENSQLKLDGFAGGSCNTIGKVTENIELPNSAQARVNVHIVPDWAQSCPMIIGKDILDDQVVVRVGGKMTIFPVTVPRKS
jgi:hypothetical protein